MKLSTLLLSTVLALFYSCQYSAIKEKEKTFLITEIAFKNYGLTFIPNNSTGKFSKINFPDGSAEINYTFEGNSTDSSYLYLSNSVHFVSSANEAIKIFNANALAEKFGRFANSDFISIEGSSYGEMSELKLWLHQNKPLGNIYQFIKGSYCYTIIIKGTYFDNANDWKLFFTEIIEPGISLIEEPAGAYQ